MSDPCSPPHSPTGPEVEAQLRNLGLGYRARFVSASARAILEERGGLPWLQQLRKAPYEEAHKALCTLPGVGTKVRPGVEGGQEEATLTSHAENSRGGDKAARELGVGLASGGRVGGRKDTSRCFIRENVECRKGIKDIAL